MGTFVAWIPPLTIHRKSELKLLHTQGNRNQQILLAEAKLGQVANNPGICLNNLSTAWKCRSKKAWKHPPFPFFVKRALDLKKNVPRWWVYELITSRCFITFSKTPHSGHCFFLFLFFGGGNFMTPSLGTKLCVCCLGPPKSIATCSKFFLKNSIWIIKWNILEKVLNEFLHKNERPAKREMGHIHI